MTKKLKIICSALLAALSLSAISSAHAIDYKFSTLVDLGRGSDASSINNYGDVVGDIHWQQYSTGYRFPVMWRASGLVPLDESGMASSINDSGQTVGWTRTQATLWDGSTTTNLGALGALSGSVSRAFSINNSGQVVGDAYLPGSNYRPILWNGSTVTDLGTIGGSAGEALSINDFGKIVGVSSVNDETFVHATLWDSGKIIDLGTLGGMESVANAINNAGLVAGWSWATGSELRHATVWNGTTATNLDSLGPFNSEAFGINSLGQIVGYSQDVNYTNRATLWSGSDVIDLNNVLDSEAVSQGWVLETASDINDNGWIVGRAFNRISYRSSSYLLSIPATPVPEPESSALILAGLFALAVSRRQPQRRG